MPALPCSAANSSLQTHSEGRCCEGPTRRKEATTRNALLRSAGLLLLALFAPAVASSQARSVETYGKLPLSFEANLGQTDPSVKFLARGQGYSLFLTSTEAVLSLSRGRGPAAVLRLKLVGGNPAPLVLGEKELPGESSYFMGPDPAKWRTHVPNYAQVRYRDVYPGIDLVYYGNQGKLEYDFVVAPGADPKRIRLKVAGAEKVALDAQGDLVLHSAGREIAFHKPLVYQQADGVRKGISGRYALRRSREISFEMAAYDVGKPLIIDPVLGYSTYLGGSGYEQALGITVDASGSVYVTGSAS